jgi:NADPH-dependent curcumin reductase CurA
MQGFIVFDYASQYAAARKEIAQWLSEGKLQRKETIIKGGLKAAEKGLLDLYQGINTGKFFSPPVSSLFCIFLLDPEAAIG